MNPPLELIVSVYDDPNRAQRVLGDIRRVVKDGQLEIKDAAVLVKDAGGSVHQHDSEDVGAGSGALFGAITGGLIGLLAGPGGAIAGAVAGAATGGVTAALVDTGFSDDELAELRASMPPSSSALVLLIEHTWVERLVQQLEQQRSKLFRREVSPRR